MTNQKKTWLFLLKAIFSFSILTYIFIKIVPLEEILSIIQQTDLFWLSVSFSLHALGLVISAVRWQILFKGQGHSVPLTFLIKSYLVGTFFNNFMPTRIGGDLVRIWDGSRFSQTLVKSSAIVLVERLTGIIVLFLFALAASLIRVDMAKEIPIIWISLLTGAIGLTCIISAILPLSDRLTACFPNKGIFQKTRDKIFEFKKTVLAYKNEKSALLKAFFWAFLLQINVIVHFYLIGKALHLEISLVDYFIFIPVVLLIQLVPITINGLGVREYTYIHLFPFYGILQSTAVAFSLIDVAFMLTVGAIGGIVYAFRK